jgi:glycosyltransferase involved in cell wall biosynthesis
MRLLLLNYEFPPLGGGASAATFFMARELVARGHQVEVLTSSAPGHPATDVIDGVRVHRVFSLRRGVQDAGLLGAATFVMSAIGKLRELARDGNFDCAHFYFALPTGMLAPLWMRWAKRPYVVGFRGSDVPGYDGGRLLAMLHRVLRPLTRRILAGASHVTANSKSLQQLAQQSFPWLRIQDIPNAVCTTTFRPSEEPRRGGRPRLLTVSRLVRRKGLEDLISAMASPFLSGCRLTIVGEGRLQSELEMLTRSLGVADRVDFPGRRHGEDLSACYRDADCFVLASHAESCSMSLLEAMASGLPVVAARTGGIPEFVEDLVNGRLYQPGDVDDLAKAIGWMLESDERRERMGAANRLSVSLNHSWPKIASLYEQRCYSPELAVHRAAAADKRADGQPQCDQATS